jgi:DMSO/TMAO reductase YedYZ molybdopterin-dependent catalytic subunit
MKVLRSFWCGAAAGCAFVVLALVARAVHSTPTLPELVQDRLVLLLPGSLFSYLLDHFLYLGKPILFGGLLLAQVLIGGIAGIAIGRLGRPALTALALWLFTGLVLLPLVHRGVFDRSLAVAVVTLLGYAAYAVAYTLFAGLPASLPARLRSSRDAGNERKPDAMPVRLDRRRLLAGGLLGVAAVLLARRAIGRLPSLPPRGRALAAGGGAQPGDGSVAGLPAAVTPADEFYVVSKNLLDPELDAGKWRLHIDGLVAHPLTLSYGDLTGMPSVEMYRTLECISNEVGGDLISNGLWTGVRLADLLQRAGVQPDAKALRFTCADDYTADMPLAQALDPTTLLVYKLDGVALPAKHGYPARILATGTYGMKNPKWPTRIELLAGGSTGFWQEQGWDEQAIVQTMAEVVTPEDGARLPAGPIAVTGIAFAGARGIMSVEVSTDGGTTWSNAELLPSLGPNTWSFWRYGWQLSRPGPYTIVARATDGTGVAQTMRRTDPFPAGATGYHEIMVRAGA